MGANWHLMSDTCAESCRVAAMGTEALENLVLDLVTAYVCMDFICYPPISDLHGFDNAMKRGEIMQSVVGIAHFP